MKNITSNPVIKRCYAIPFGEWPAHLQAEAHQILENQNGAVRHGRMSATITTLYLRSLEHFVGYLHLQRLLSTTQSFRDAFRDSDTRSGYERYCKDRGHLLQLLRAR